MARGNVKVVEKGVWRKETACVKHETQISIADTQQPLNAFVCFIVRRQNKYKRAWINPKSTAGTPKNYEQCKRQKGGVWPRRSSADSWPLTVCCTLSPYLAHIDTITKSFIAMGHITSAHPSSHSSTYPMLFIRNNKEKEQKLSNNNWVRGYEKKLFISKAMQNK